MESSRPMSQLFFLICLISRQSKVAQCPRCVCLDLEAPPSSETWVARPLATRRREQTSSTWRQAFTSSLPVARFVGIFERPLSLDLWLQVASRWPQAGAAPGLKYLGDQERSLTQELEFCLGGKAVMWGKPGRPPPTYAQHVPSASCL